MAENKTKATDASVNAYLAGIDDESRRRDCAVLAGLMSKVTGHTPRMWGPSIVGFDSYHYKYDSGREGDMCLVGFAARKDDISIYGTASAPNHAALLEKLGKHKMGKGCLYIRRLADVDLKVLERMIAGAVSVTRKRGC